LIERHHVLPPKMGHLILGFLGALSKESGDVVLLKPVGGDPLAMGGDFDR
jgi:hypothetical protein